MKVLGGSKFNSLKGSDNLVIDHMANVGIYAGVTAKSPEFKKFLILTDVREVRPKKSGYPWKRSRSSRLSRNNAH